MKQKGIGAVSAFTRIELVVVIGLLVLLAAMLLPAIVSPRTTALRITCLNNLKVIGVAYRLWQGDAHADSSPATESLSRWGWKDLLTNADQGINCWSNYAIIADYLPHSPDIPNPKYLACPADERLPATDFMTNGNRYVNVPHGVNRIEFDKNAPPLPNGHTYFKDNSNLSYFVGVSANADYPQSIQGGDRNLGPGANPDRDYGFSPKDGKGNDVAVPVAGPVSWSLKMHSAVNTYGADNILLGDGAALQVSSSSFRTILIRADPTTNWPVGHIPATPSIRLVFP